jgi:hypothetical protein
MQKCSKRQYRNRDQEVDRGVQTMEVVILNNFAKWELTPKEYVGNFCLE